MAVKTKVQTALPTPIKGQEAPTAKAGDISKMEAVRQAMGQLGFDATRTEIQRFVQERFGIAMNVDVISSYKADVARKAAKAKLVVTKPTAPKPAAPKPAAEPPVRAVVPVLVAITATKPATPKPAAKPAAKPATKKQATSMPQAKPAPERTSNGRASGGVSLTDVQTVKELVNRLGSTDLITLVDVLAK